MTIPRSFEDRLLTLILGILFIFLSWAIFSQAYCPGDDVDRLNSRPCPEEVSR